MTAMPQSMIWNMCGPLTGRQMGEQLARWRNAGLVKSATIGSVRWVWCTTFGHELAGRAPYRDETPPTENTWRHLRAVCLVRAAIESMGGEWISNRYLRWEAEHRTTTPTGTRKTTRKVVTTTAVATPATSDDGAVTAEMDTDQRYYPDGLAWLVPRAAGTGWPWLVRVHLTSGTDTGTGVDWDTELTALIDTGTALTSSNEFCVLYVVADHAYEHAAQKIADHPDRDRFHLQRLGELAPLGKQWFSTRTTRTK